MNRIPQHSLQKPKIDSGIIRTTNFNLNLTARMNQTASGLFLEQANEDGISFLTPKIDF